MAEATVEEIAGFISGNAKRKQILDVLEKKGSKTSEDLRKITRMPRIILEKVLIDMVENGVIIKQDDSFSLTENGKKAANISLRKSNKSSVHKFDSNVQRDI
jgi:predicted transcriptional regulator